MGDLLRICDYHRRRPEAPIDHVGEAVVIILPIVRIESYGAGPQPRCEAVLSSDQRAMIRWGLDQVKAYPVFRLPAAPPMPKPDR